MAPTFFSIVLRMCLVMMLIPLMMLHAQDGECSVQSVVASFEDAALNNSMDAWLEGYQHSNCPEQMLQGIRGLSEAYFMLVDLHQVSSSDPCSARAFIASFVASALSNDVDAWLERYTNSTCSSELINVANRLNAAFLQLNSQSALVIRNVAVVGTFQRLLGCGDDWLPSCTTTLLIFDAEDKLWFGEFDLPAGTYEYKVAINGTWDENYGANAQLGGTNIQIDLKQNTAVKFLYDHHTHWVADSINNIIANVPGSFQSEIGCPASGGVDGGDWLPDCLRSWLQDPDDDGTYSYITTNIPSGDYEAKVALNETWELNYGANSVRDGANIPFSVPIDFAQVSFNFNSANNLLTIIVDTTIIGNPQSDDFIQVIPSIPQPQLVVIPGTIQSVLGCSGDWQPDCHITALVFDPEKEVWRGGFNLPLGDYEYKVALNGSWAENYGDNGIQDGPNIPLSVRTSSTVYFCYDHRSHVVTHSFTAPDVSVGCE